MCHDKQQILTQSRMTHRLTKSDQRAKFTYLVAFLRISYTEPAIHLEMRAPWDTFSIMSIPGDTSFQRKIRLPFGRQHCSLSGPGGSGKHLKPAGNWDAILHDHGSTWWREDAWMCMKLIPTYAHPPTPAPSSERESIKIVKQRNVFILLPLRSVSISSSPSSPPSSACLPAPSPKLRLGFSGYCEFYLEIKG